MFNETEGLKAGEFDRKLEENGAESNAATWLDWTYYYESLPKDRFAPRGQARERAHGAPRPARAAGRRARRRSSRTSAASASTTTSRAPRTSCSTRRRSRRTRTTGRRSAGWRTSRASRPTTAWPSTRRTTRRTTRRSSSSATCARADVLAKHPRRRTARSRASTIPDGGHAPRAAAARGARRRRSRSRRRREKLLIGYHGPALGDADHAPLAVLNEVLFGGRASRLYRALVTTREIATELRGWVSTFRDPGLYEMYFTARAGHDDATSSSRALDARARDASATRLVTDDELERAKARLELGAPPVARDGERQGRADRLLRHGRSAIRRRAFRRLEAYRRVTAGDVRRVARRYLVEPRADDRPRPARSRRDAEAPQ